jgi:hypothetical protein
VSLIGLTLAYGILPFARRWHAREQLIAVELERLARTRGLLASEPALHRTVRAAAAALESGPQRLLAGRTPALAASTLQSVLQEFADRSRVIVSRLDVAGAPDTAGTALPMIPATVSAIGDVYGITDLLTMIQHGALALEITGLSLRPNQALRGNLLQMTVTLRGAYLGS